MAGQVTCLPIQNGQDICQFREGKNRSPTPLYYGVFNTFRPRTFDDCLDSTSRTYANSMLLNSSRRRPARVLGRVMPKFSEPWTCSAALRRRLRLPSPIPCLAARSIFRAALLSWVYVLTWFGESLSQNLCLVTYRTRTQGTSTQPILGQRSSSMQ